MVYNINDMKLPKPTTQLQEVLYMLIESKEITRKEFVNIGILNHTARLTTLRHKYNLYIPCRKINAVNKFGREVEFGAWRLANKDHAISVYKQLINQKE